MFLGDTCDDVIDVDTSGLDNLGLEILRFGMHEICGWKRIIFSLYSGTPKPPVPYNSGNVICYILSSR